MSRVQLYHYRVSSLFHKYHKSTKKAFCWFFPSNIIFYDYITCFNLIRSHVTFTIWQSSSLFAISVYYMFRIKLYFFSILNIFNYFSTEAINIFRLNFYVQYWPSKSSNMFSGIFTHPFMFTGAILYRVYYAFNLIILLI